MTGQPSLPANVTVLHAPSRFPQTLLPQPTPLLGRDAEVTEIRARLGDPLVRLLTVTGPGGTGKTRLAFEAAAGLLDRFTHGVVFVDLAPVRDAALVPVAIAETVGVRQTNAGSAVDALVSVMERQEVLLVLDNFEHVLAAAAEIVELVAACPEVKVLVTSRAPLRVRREQEFPVAPLALPSPDLAGDLVALALNPAVALFVQRARAVRPDFALTKHNAPDVTAICIRLQGMPLAIELAAARIRVLSPRTLLTRLIGGAGAPALQLLSDGGRDLPERQRSLRDTITWSHDLLSPPEKFLFRRLAVFSGGWTAEAAEAVCAGNPSNGQSDRLTGTVLDGLSSLVEQSLVVQHVDPDGDPRLSMLETIHEFSRDQLVASGEEDAVRRRHAQYFLQRAETGGRGMEGASQTGWVRRLEVDHQNVRAAIGWALDAGEGGVALRFCAALADFWRITGHYREGRALSARALAAAPHAPAAVRAAVIEGSGVLAYIQHDPVEARRLIDAGVDLWRTVNNDARLCFALAYQGMLARQSGDPVTARASCEEALTYSFLEPHLRTGHRLALSQLGYLAEAEGDRATARRLQEESLRVARGLSAMDLAIQLINVAIATLQTGDLREADEYFREALALSRDMGAAQGIAGGLEGLAALAVARGQPRRAAELLGAASALRAAVGGPPIAEHDEVRRRTVPQVQGALGEDAFAAATAYGGARPLAESISRALAHDDLVEAPELRDAPLVSTTVGGLGSDQPPTALPDRLTARQLDYLRLLAQGLTNKAIAGTLVVSEAAVETMLVRLYEKIHARNRAEAIRYAYDHGLIDRSSP